MNVWLLIAAFVLGGIVIGAVVYFWACWQISKGFRF